MSTEKIEFESVSVSIQKGDVITMSFVPRRTFWEWLLRRKPKPRLGEWVVTWTSDHKEDNDGNV